MKIILLSDVYNHGVAGEVVEVAPGFARNYLIPKKLAVKATEAELKRAEKLREQAEARRAAYENKLNELGRQIDGTNLTFVRRAANTGKLFGSVTTSEMADALMDATGVDINRRRISVQALREVGMHHVPVRLGTEVSPVLHILVIAEDQQQVYQRQVEALEAGLIEELMFNDNGRLVEERIPTVKSAPAEEAEAAQDEEEDEGVVEAALDVVEAAADVVGDAVEAATDAVTDAVQSVVGGDDDANDEDDTNA